MAAGKHDMVLDQGSTFTRQITWKDSTDSPVDLTGYTARMQIRSTVRGANTVLSLTTENGRIALGGAAGTIDLTIAATTTATLEPTTYAYDLELVSGSVVTRLLYGSLTVRGEVTR